MTNDSFDTLNDSNDNDNEDSTSDNTSSTISTSFSESSSSLSDSNVTNKRKKQKVYSSWFQFTAYIKEDHKYSIFGVECNHYLPPNAPLVFATAGKNRIYIYECDKERPNIRLVDAYVDPDKSEVFYTCAWTYDESNGAPLLAAAGFRGIIRIISPTDMCCIKTYTGHGHAINQLKISPEDPNLLLSVSKDHSMRLWNIKTNVCVAIFSGIEGHRDEVLSADFYDDGSKIMSAGMDHSLKLWKLTNPKIKSKIESSYENQKDFKCVNVSFPDYSTRNVHKNYVDCVLWFGDFVLSKACDNKIALWKPGRLEDRSPRLGDTTVTPIKRFRCDECDLWFIRFAVDTNQKFLAVGNNVGKIFMWNLDVSEIDDIQRTVIEHPKCTSAIRQLSFSKDGSILIAVCDDQTVWRLDKTG